MDDEVFNFDFDNLSNSLFEFLTFPTFPHTSQRDQDLSLDTPMSS